MRPILRLILTTCAAAGFVAIWPADLEAQRRRARVSVVRPAVVVSAHYSHPYYAQVWYPYPYGPYTYRLDYRGSIRIQDTPREAEVYVNGYYVGLVDDFDGLLQRLYLEPGEYEVAVYLDGFRTRREPVLVRPGQSYRIRLPLEPLAPGDPADPRPSTATSPAPVAYDPRTRPGAPDEAPRESLGTLSIRVQPGGAEVFIDGERWEWPAGEDRLVLEVPVGARHVEVRLDGHRPYATTVNVRRSEVTTLNVSLPRVR